MNIHLATQITPQTRSLKPISSTTYPALDLLPLHHACWTPWEQTAPCLAAQLGHPDSQSSSPPPILKQEALGLLCSGEHLFPAEL